MNKQDVLIKWEYWQRIVSECNAKHGEQTKKAWLEQRGIDYRSFIYWQRKVKDEAAASASTAIVSGNDPSAMTGAPFGSETKAFVDVTNQIAIDLPQPEIPNTMTSAPQVMIQAGNYNIYVNRAVDEQTLYTVMKVLSHA